MVPRCERDPRSGLVAALHRGGRLCGALQALATTAKSTSGDALVPSFRTKITASRSSSTCDSPGQHARNPRVAAAPHNRVPDPTVLFVPSRTSPGRCHSSTELAPAREHGPVSRAAPTLEPAAHHWRTLPRDSRWSRPGTSYPSHCKCDLTGRLRPHLSDSLSGPPFATA
jgi:hypothetical protein